MAAAEAQGSVSSDEESEEDELLNFQPFSQSTVELSQQPDEESNGGDESDNESDIEREATKKVGRAAIPPNITSVSQLFWRRQMMTKGKKKQTIYIPCRKCCDDELIGMNIPRWDPPKTVAIRYIEYPYEGETEAVSPTVLVPYHGDDENRNEHVWSPKLMPRYIEHLEDIGTYTKCDIRAVLLYLDRILDHLRKTDQKQLVTKEEGNGDSAGLMESFDMVIDEKMKAVEMGPDKEGDIAESSSDDETDHDKSEHKTELIRAGDIVAYDSHVYVKGDQRGRREASVLSVDPKRDPVLVLSNGDYLPKDTEVKRIKVVFRNKLKDHSDGVYRRIDSFILRRSYPKGQDANDAAAGILVEAKRLQEIMERNREDFHKKAKAIGFAPKDILYSAKKSKTEGTGKENTSKVSPAPKKGPPSTPRISPAKDKRPRAGKGEKPSTPKSTSKAASKQTGSSRMTPEQKEKTTSKVSSTSKKAPLGKTGKGRKPITPKSASKVASKQTGSSRKTPEQKEKTTSKVSSASKKASPRQTGKGGKPSTPKSASKATSKQTGRSKTPDQKKRAISKVSPDSKKPLEKNASTPRLLSKGACKQTRSSRKASQVSRTPSVTSTPRSQPGRANSEVRMAFSTPRVRGIKRRAESRMLEESRDKTMKAASDSYVSRRRRMSAAHMSQDQLEIASEVTEILCGRWGKEKIENGINDVSDELNISSYSLHWFLKGDPKCLIRQDQHKATETALAEWLNGNGLSS